MLDTLNHDAELPITKDDCIEYLDSIGREAFVTWRGYGQRIGQAWFNSLTPSDCAKLTGTLYDPFYRDDWLSVRQALMFLLEN